MSFTASASLQLRSIYALMLRRIRTKYVGSRAGYMWAIVEPMAWVFVLKLAFTRNATQQPPVGDSYEVFFVTGVVLARGWRVGVSNIAPLLWRPNRQPLPALHRLDVVFATWLLVAVTDLTVLTVCLAVLSLFGFHVLPANMVVCLAAFAATAAYTLAFALAYALVIAVAPGIKHFHGIIILILFMSSGFAMLVDRMPPKLRDIMLWNPLVHCIEWFREGFYAGYECASLSQGYLISVIVIFLLLGLAGERAFSRREVKVWEMQSDD